MRFSLSGFSIKTVDRDTLTRRYGGNVHTEDRDVDMNKPQTMRDEIRNEIKALKQMIASAPTDPESQWACYLLRTCLDSRERKLEALSKEEAA